MADIVSMSNDALLLVLTVAAMGLPLFALWVARKRLRHSASLRRAAERSASPARAPLPSPPPPSLQPSAGAAAAKVCSPPPQPPSPPSLHPAAAAVAQLLHSPPPPQKSAQRTPAQWASPIADALRVKLDRAKTRERALRSELLSVNEELSLSLQQSARALGVASCVSPPAPLGALFSSETAGLAPTPRAASAASRPASALATTAAAAAIECAASAFVLQLGPLHSGAAAQRKADREAAATAAVANALYAAQLAAFDAARAAAAARIAALEANADAAATGMKTAASVRAADAERTEAAARATAAELRAAVEVARAEVDETKTLSATRTAQLASESTLATLAAAAATADAAEARAVAAELRNIVQAARAEVEETKTLSAVREKRALQLAEERTRAATIEIATITAEAAKARATTAELLTVVKAARARIEGFETAAKSSKDERQDATSKAAATAAAETRAASDEIVRMQRTFVAAQEEAERQEKMHDLVPHAVAGADAAAAAAAAVFADEEDTRLLEVAALAATMKANEREAQRVAAEAKRLEPIADAAAAAREQEVALRDPAKSGGSPRDKPPSPPSLPSPSPSSAVEEQKKEEVVAETAAPVLKAQEEPAGEEEEGEQEVPVAEEPGAAESMRARPTPAAKEEEAALEPAPLQAAAAREPEEASKPEQQLPPAGGGDPPGTHRRAVTLSIVVEAAGSLGLSFDADKHTCLAVVARPPLASGAVEATHPGAVREGDVLRAINGNTFVPVRAFDPNGDGCIDRDEVIAAMQTTELRAAFLHQRPDLAALNEALDDEALVDLIILHFDKDGNGELNDEEVATFLQMMLHAIIGHLAQHTRPITLSFTRASALVSTHNVDIAAAGSLGLSFDIDPHTCLAIVHLAPLPSGAIELAHPGAVRAGDILRSVNEHTFVPITAFDDSGCIDRGELLTALRTTDLREAFVLTTRLLVNDALDDEGVVDLIVAHFDVEGTGELSDEEVKAFHQMMLHSIISRLARQPRPLALSFDRIL